MATMTLRPTRSLFSSAMLVVALACPALARAQQAPIEVAIDDLKAPPSPAFVLLGVAPSKVERPQAVRPLALSALAAASTEGFPKNYAVEFAPYWLGTPTLSFDDYYHSSVGEAVVRHLSLSVATTPLAKTDTPGTSLGVGARTLPLPGRPHPKLEALRKRLQDLQSKTIDEEGFFGRRQRFITLLQEAQSGAVAATASTLAGDTFEALIDKMIDLDLEIEKLRIIVAEEPTPEAKAALQQKQKERKQLGAEMLKAIEQSDVAKNLATEKQFEILVARYDQAQKARLARLAADLKQTALAIQALDTQRVGAMVAVATAFAWDVPDDDTSQSSLSKVGFWITPGYRLVRCDDSGEECSSAVDLLGVVRYLDNRRPDDESSTWELGGRLLWQAQTKLAVSGEWLGRTGGDSPGYRLVGVAEYEITGAAFLYASFGRDFEEKGVRKNLVSTVGLTFGFGKKPIITN